MSLLSQAGFSRGVTNALARDVLLSVLEEIDTQLSWKLFVDPTGAALNIHRVSALRKRSASTADVARPNPVSAKKGGGIEAKLKSNSDGGSAAK